MKEGIVRPGFAPKVTPLRIAVISGEQHDRIRRQAGFFQFVQDEANGVIQFDDLCGPRLVRHAPGGGHVLELAEFFDRQRSVNERSGIVEEEWPFLIFRDEFDRLGAINVLRIPQMGRIFAGLVHKPALGVVYIRRTVMVIFGQVIVVHVPVFRQRDFRGIASLNLMRKIRIQPERIADAADVKPAMPGHFGRIFHRPLFGAGRFVEEPRLAPLLHVPFAKDGGGVASRVEHLGHGGIELGAQSLGILLQRGEMPRGPTGQQRSSRRGAPGRAGIGIGKDATFRREPVNIRGRKMLLAEAAQIPIGKIVGQNENEVGPVGPRRRFRRVDGHGLKNYGGQDSQNRRGVFVVHHGVSDWKQLLWELS